MPRKKKTEEDIALVESTEEEKVRKSKYDWAKSDLGVIRLPGIDGYGCRIRIYFTNEMLGTSPSDPEIYKSFVGSKAPDAKTLKQELESISVDEAVENKQTVFRKDKNGTPYIAGYMLKGMFKNACKMLKDNTSTKTSKMKNYLQRCNGIVHVGPNAIRINMPEESKIGVCERPLRANTAQGERIALASSETVPSGSWSSFLLFAETEAMFDILLNELLPYGAVNGLGQWHNASKGTFVFEVLNYKTNEVIGGLGNKNMSSLFDEDQGLEL